MPSLEETKSSKKALAHLSIPCEGSLHKPAVTLRIDIEKEHQGFRMQIMTLASTEAFQGSSQGRILGRA